LIRLSALQPLSGCGRLVTARISTVRVLILVTDDSRHPPPKIADLDKARWQIELFFK
jgi:IS4 transposase